MSVASTIAQLAGAVGFGAIVTSGIAYIRDRRKEQINADEAEASLPAKVRITDIGSLQAELVLLQGIIDTQANQITRESKKLEDALTREEKLRARVFELEDQVQKLKINLSETQQQCERIEKELLKIRQEG